MNKIIRPALMVFVMLTVVTGLLYPLLITGLAQAFFPYQANGSLVVKDGKAIGSRLIGQNFSDPKYFWGRPSATGPMPYNAANSAGSNLGPTNPAQLDAVRGRIAALKAAGPVPAGPIPVDLVTASGSGLDPDISPAAADYQVLRIAAVRKLSIGQVRALVEHHIAGRQWGILGEPRVNVLRLNLALDQLK
jgi:potassium-transporting ATPase KdpC subunit